ncbi:MAG TPA: hypothetical protein VFK03_02685, partial [Candidatus Saccharimonadales bacterium]|nr:hypothetical protein [Candidatus Saccharimonadales bacterium]
ADNFFPFSQIIFAGGTTRVALDPLGKRYASEQVFTAARAQIGDRLGVQKNDLSYKTAVNQPFDEQPADNAWRILYDAAPYTSAQMLSGVRQDRFVTDDYTGTAHDAFMEAIECGLDYGARFFEIYPGDVLDPEFQDVIAYAHAETVR